MDIVNDKETISFPDTLRWAAAYIEQHECSDPVEALRYAADMFDKHGVNSYGGLYEQADD